MQAFLDGSALKPLTKALTCLAKYGDEVTIYATPETFSLSTTNSSMSAYARFKYSRHFFTRYNISSSRNEGADDAQSPPTVTGQLLVKSLLLILKHRSSDKNVEKCELSIQEGSDDPSEESDSLESRLIVRLYCKHGVTKTHRLIISPPQSLLAPEAPDPEEESQLTIGPLAMRDLISHFPAARNARSDPQLMWSFDKNDVQVRSFESSLDFRGSAHLSTEITITTGEFETYDVRSLPITIAFHLREFNASIAYAESMSLALDLRFTNPTAPLFIDVEADDIETLFVISTTHLSDSQQRGATNSQQRQMTSNRKRARDQDSDGMTPVPVSVPSSTRKRPMKAVHRIDLPAPNRTSMGPPSSVPNRGPDPLFLPSLSQLSVREQQSMQEAGLAGITSMEDVDQLFNDEEGEEFLNTDAADDPPMTDGEDMVFAPTQEASVERTFKPLFDD